MAYEPRTPPSSKLCPKTLVLHFDVLWCCQNGPLRIRLGFALASLWLRLGFAMASLWLRNGFAMVLLWFADMPAQFLQHGIFNIVVV